MKKCNTCGSNLSDSARSCYVCGSKDITVMDRAEQDRREEKWRTTRGRCEAEASVGHEHSENGSSASEQSASGDAKPTLAGMDQIYDVLNQIKNDDRAREQEMTDIKRSLKEIRDASVERNSTLKVIKICVIVIALIALFFLADSIYKSHKIGSSVRDLERMFRNF